MGDEVEYYAPEPRRRYPVELEHAGYVSFHELDTDAQEDVMQCVGSKLGVSRKDVFKRLFGRRIPVYLVDPAVLIGDSGRDVRVDDVERYGALLQQDPGLMPPVLINTDDLEYPLCEGGHRTVGAIKAGVPQIYAIDAAKAYIQGDQILFRV